MTTIFSELAAELGAVRESAARARESIEATLAECAIREASAAAREEGVHGAATAEWRSWTPAQRRSVAELFSEACWPHGCFVRPPDSRS
jgi:hypothetical protein